MNRRQKLWIAVIFLLVLLISGAINMPARQLLRVVQIPPAIEMYGLDGTVARARVEQLRVQSMLSLTDVRLDIQPLCLLKGAICYRVYADDKNLDASIQFSLISQEIRIEEGGIKLGKEIFQQFDTLLVKPKGTFDIKIDALALKDRKLLSLNGKINWLNAGIEGEEQLLGNYLAVVSTTGDGVEVSLSDKGSLLKVQGKLLLQWTGDYSVDVNLEARPGLKPSIKSALGLIAQRAGLDRYSIRKKARLNGWQKKLLDSIHLSIKRPI